MQLEVPLSATANALFAAPQHAGRPSSGRFRRGAGGAVKSGSLIEFWLAVQGDRIVQARFEVFGGPAAIACGEWLCRWLIGRDHAAVQELSGLQLAESLELPAAKRTVALLAEDAVKAALAAPECAVDNHTEGSEHGT